VPMRGRACRRRRRHQQRLRLPRLWPRLRLVCAEQLAEGAGAGDFDARLLITAGPARVGEIIFLGGVMEIEIGKLPEKHIQLEANMVSDSLQAGSRRFRPVALEDRRQTEHQRPVRQPPAVSRARAPDGDQVNIGGFQLEYSNAAPGGRGRAHRLAR